MSAFENQIGGSHYAELPSQPAKFLRDNAVPHLEGEAICRIIRHKSKNGAEDLRKAIHTLELILEMDYGNDNGDAVHGANR